MSVKVFAGNTEQPVKFWSFPGGERGVRVEWEFNFHSYTVDVDFRSSDDLIDMLMTVDAIRGKFPASQIRAKIPYFPYARQDRRAVIGEAHSMRVIAAMVNSCNFTEVEVWDPHSDVVEALIDRIVIKTQAELAMRDGVIPNGALLIAPDAGAAKKIYKLASILGSDVVVLEKSRDPKTGRLEAGEISVENLKKISESFEVWMVDDICDGGGTFIAAIEKIKSSLNKEGFDIPPITLYTTHGIYSKGAKPLGDAGFKGVACINKLNDNIYFKD